MRQGYNEIREWTDNCLFAFAVEIVDIFQSFVVSS